MNISSRKLKNSHQGDNVGVDPEIGLLPVGEEITLGGVTVRGEDVGNALQFLEFCSVFRKVLNLEKKRAKDVLEDIFPRRERRRGKFSVTVKFHKDMLAVIKKEQGQDCTRLLASGNNSWFTELKTYLSESQSALTAHGLGCLDDIDDYATLLPSQKLKLLNVFCDEILATDKVRNWIDKHIKEAAKSYKEARQKLSAAKQEEKNMKQKLKDGVIITSTGAALSVFECEDVLSGFKYETAKAQANVVLEKDKKQPDAVRLEPIFKSYGYSYWKPNISSENDILSQRTGDNNLTLNEKWSTINVQEKEMIEKHISAAAPCSSASSSRGNQLKEPRV